MTRKARIANGVELQFGSAHKSTHSIHTSSPSPSGLIEKSPLKIRSSLQDQNASQLNLEILEDRMMLSSVTKLWLAIIRSRSQRGRNGWTWDRMQRLARKHLPRPRVTHPYPNKRFHARLKVGAV